MLLDISILPATMAAMAMLGLAWDTLAPASLREAARPRFLRVPTARPRRPQAGGGLGEAQLAVLHSKVQELEATVARLRQNGHSVVAQRDAARAEAASLRLALGAAQQELARGRQHDEFAFLAKAVLREPPPPPVFSAPDPADSGKFRSAKLAFARLYHPDRGGSSELDRLIRAQVFKEFWTELERIEKG
jgi:outer membrane murein-binding lipoprotein Lpp